MEKEKSGPNFTKRSSTNVPIYWILEEFFSDPTIDEVIVERIKANLQSNSLPSHVADTLKGSNQENHTSVLETTPIVKHAQEKAVF